METHTSTDQILDLKNQKIAEALAEFDKEYSLEETRESIFIGISNLAPVMPALLEKCDEEQMNDFFFSLRRINELFKECSAIKNT